MTNTLEYLSELQDLVDLNDFMADEELGEAMDLAMKCIAKPDMPPAKARTALLRMQALAFRFRMQAATYTYIHTGKAGTPENVKKNVYFAASEQCDKLAQTLKYLVKEYY
jgi:hypothetical protein